MDGGRPQQTHGRVFAGKGPFLFATFSFGPAKEKVDLTNLKSSTHSIEETSRKFFLHSLAKTAL
ncbi:MAG: hypothetical protein IJS69_00735 [Selenomonadaceae bacterium]|nr:hypothetical protein [Selenomonadaceae bacterium]